MFTKTLIAATMALTIGTVSYGETYKIDTAGAHASINFEASHFGYSFIVGRFDTFNGSFEFDADNPAASSVAVSIEMNSVNSNHGKRDNHLRSADFFDARKYPTANFVSTGVKVNDDKTGVITGDLTMRGVTKSVDLDVNFIGMGDDPWGGYRAGFRGTTTINLGDFGMDKAMGAIPVKLNIVAEGIRQ